MLAASIAHVSHKAQWDGLHCIPFVMGWDSAYMMKNHVGMKIGDRRLLTDYDRTIEGKMEILRTQYFEICEGWVFWF